MFHTKFRIISTLYKIVSYGLVETKRLIHVYNVMEGLVPEIYAEKFFNKSRPKRTINPTVFEQFILVDNPVDKSAINIKKPTNYKESARNNLGTPFSSKQCLTRIILKKKLCIRKQ